MKEQKPSVFVTATPIVSAEVYREAVQVHNSCILLKICRIR